jgi:uncharacterized membrane protein YeaQ/YmgE (transglycosylase-associated protein family)
LVINNLKTNKMSHSTTDFLIFLATGAVSGWLGSKIVGANTGLITNIGLGIIGAFVGTYLLGHRLGSGLLPSIVTAGIGAAIVLFVYSLIARRL